MLLGSLFACAVLLAANPAEAGLDAISVQPRARAVLLVVSPKGTTSGVASATLFDAANTELETRTDLELESIERTGVDSEVLRACPHDRPLGCWVNALADSPKTGAHPEPRILLVVSLYPIETGEHVLHVSLIDLTSALRSYVQLRDHGDQDWRDQAEDAIHTGAVHAEPQHLSNLDPGTLRAYFAARFDGDFRPLFEQSGHLARLGRMLLTGTPKGLEILVDGRPAGRTRAERTELADVPVGSREVVLRSQDGSAMSTTVKVEPGASARLEYVPPPPPASVFRRTALWTSVGVGTVGVALSIVAALQAGADVRTGCVIAPGGASAGCPNPGLPRLSFDSDAAPDVEFDALNPGGPSTAALGFALLGAGTVSAVSILLFGEEADDPWAQIGAGLAVGIGTFAVVTLIDPRERAP